MNTEGLARGSFAFENEAQFLNLGSRQREYKRTLDGIMMFTVVITSVKIMVESGANPCKILCRMNPPGVLIFLLKSIVDSG